MKVVYASFIITIAFKQFNLMRSRKVRPVISIPCRITLFDQDPKLLKSKGYRLATNLTAKQCGSFKPSTVNSFTIDRALQSKEATTANKFKTINTLIRLHLQRLHVRSKSHKDEQVTAIRYPESSYDLYSLSQITKESRQLINSFKDSPAERKSFNAMPRQGQFESKAIKRSLQEISQTEVAEMLGAEVKEQSMQMPEWFNEVMKDVSAKDELMKQATRSISTNSSKFLIYG